MKTLDIKAVRKIILSFVVAFICIFAKGINAHAYFNCVYAKIPVENGVSKPEKADQWIIIRMSNDDGTGDIVSVTKRSKSSDGTYQEKDYTNYDRSFSSCVDIDEFHVVKGKLILGATDEDPDNKLLYVKQDMGKDTGNSNQSSGVFDNSNTIDFMKQDYVYCGGTWDSALVKNIPSIIPSISSSIYNVVLVAVPIVMVLMGMVDLVKGVISQKEDEIRKGRSSLVKRSIMGLVTFLVVLLVKMLINLVSGGTSAVRIISCLDCFVSNDCPQQPKSSSKTSTTKPNPNKSAPTPMVS